MCCVSHFFVAPRTAVHQAPPSMGFSSKNTAVGGHSLLQGIFPTQRSNRSLLLWQAGSLQSEPPGKDDKDAASAIQGPAESASPFCSPLTELLALSHSSHVSGPSRGPSPGSGKLLSTRTNNAHTCVSMSNVFRVVFLRTLTPACSLLRGPPRKYSLVRAV